MLHLRLLVVSLGAIGALACDEPGPVSAPPGLIAMAYDVPDEHASIQAALDAAQPGDTVTVGPGTYFESVDLRSGVKLVGAGPAATSLSGQIRIGPSTNASVSGFLVNKLNAVGATSNVGIVGAPNGVTITNTTIQLWDVGIALTGPGSAVVRGNIVTNSTSTGIRLTNVGDVRVVDNQVRLNKKIGIEVRGAAQATIPTIAHNTLIGNGFSGALATGGAAFFADRPGNATVQNNIMTGNLSGLNVLDGPNPGHHHNLVWGNTTDYANDATVGVGDVSADPRFVDAPNKDYRLLPASPAIDRGAASTLAELAADFTGQRRPAGAAPDLGCHEYQPPAAGELVLTEVMANPADEATGEYLELMNPSAGPVDAAGLVLSDGDASDPIVAWAGGTTVVPAGGFALVLDADHPLATDPYAIPTGTVLLTVPNATLGSGLAVSDPITITRSGSVVATFGHPFDPGNTIAAERVAADLPDARTSWVASPCGASPGRANCAWDTTGPAPSAPSLAITEVMANPADQSSGEWVEVYNSGSTPLDLAGLVLSDGDSNDVLVAVAGRTSVLAPGTYGVIVDPDYVATLPGLYMIDSATTVVTSPPAALGNGFAQDDPITLSSADGTTLSTYGHPIVAPSGKSVERKGPLTADVADAWLVSTCAAGHSAGKASCAGQSDPPPVTTTVPTLVINEVLANPIDEDKDELVELYNHGTTAVDAGGLLLTDGDATDVLRAFTAGGSTLVPAGGYAVVLDPEASGLYPIPPGAVRLAPADTSIGNGLATTDPIDLIARDGVTVIATFSFPTNPGNGVSLERVGGTGDVAATWVASPCASGASPGLRNCAAPPLVDPTPRLVVSEVMANPLDEGTGEYIELANIGTSPLDVGGFVLSDGDDLDLLVAFAAGGTTVIPAGGFAVIVDQDYGLGTYPIPSTAVLLTTPDKTLGSGLAVDDPITILDHAEVVATFGHPFNPGNGIAAERVALDAPDQVGNWVAAPCPAGGSPGAPSCAAGPGDPGDPGNTGVTVVDINTASATELDAVGGIGPATAAAIIDYRTANGPFDTVEQLTAAGYTLTQVQDWQVAADGEPAYIVGLAAPKIVKVFVDVSALKESLPASNAPEAAAWIGALVRVQRAAFLRSDDTTTKTTGRFGNWGYEGGYEVEGDDQLPVVFGMAPGASSYTRAQTDVVNALVDWTHTDGDPFDVPKLYQWSGAHFANGVLARAHIYTIEGVLEVDALGDWQLRIRAKADAGVDRVVLIERWIPATDWAELEIIWAYDYKPVLVVAKNGFTYALPYRLAVAHPARAWWLATRGELLPLPRCTSHWECEADDGSWQRFTSALTAWHSAGNP